VVLGAAHWQQQLIVCPCFGSNSAVLPSHRPEEVYEVESVFGRDASSVFPNMNKDDDPMEALKASIGAKRFVSETEVRSGQQQQLTHEGCSTPKPAAVLHIQVMQTCQIWHWFTACEGPVNSRCSGCDCQVQTAPAGL
jgi:hypothetical protein